MSSNDTLITISSIDKLTKIMPIIIQTLNQNNFNEVIVVSLPSLSNSSLCIHDKYSQQKVCMIQIKGKDLNGDVWLEIAFSNNGKKEGQYTVKQQESYDLIRDYYTFNEKEYIKKEFSKFNINDLENNNDKITFRINLCDYDFNTVIFDASLLEKDPEAVNCEYKMCNDSIWNKCVGISKLLSAFNNLEITLKSLCSINTSSEPESHILKPDASGKHNPAKTIAQKNSDNFLQPTSVQSSMTTQPSKFVHSPTPLPNVPVADYRAKISNVSLVKESDLLGKDCNLTHSNSDNKYNEPIRAPVMRMPPPPKMSTDINSMTGLLNNLTNQTKQLNLNNQSKLNNQLNLSNTSKIVLNQNNKDVPKVEKNNNAKFDIVDDSIENLIDKLSKDNQEKLRQLHNLTYRQFKEIHCKDNLELETCIKTFEESFEDIDLLRMLLLLAKCESTL